MTRSSDEQEQLDDATKMEALKRLAGEVAHDFNNMLMVIGLSAEALAVERESRDVDAIREAVESATALLQKLLTFSGQAPLARSVITIPQLIEDTVALARPLLPESVTLETDCSDDLPEVRVDAERLRQTLIQTITNAVAALPDGGRIEIVARRRGDNAEITIRDNGTGMSPEVARRVFEPFFTTRGENRGAGLGLALAHGTITQHGGTITISSIPGSRTDVTITLPTAPGA